jgi:hypothetical protein
MIAVTILPLLICMAKFILVETCIARESLLVIEISGADILYYIKLMSTILIWLHEINVFDL